MDQQIIEIRIDGARRKVLLQEDTPAYYPNLYLTRELSACALNTQYKYLAHLQLFEAFLFYEKIDLVARLGKRPQPSYLSDSEISRFVIDAHLEKSTLDKKYSGIYIHPTKYTLARASEPHVRQRLEAVRDYLVFIYKKLGGRSTQDDATLKVKQFFKQKITSISPAWQKRSNDEAKALTHHQRTLLRKVMHPKSGQNPFSDPASRLRNYIILLLGLEVGLRRGEMQLLKVSDISWHDQKLKIESLKKEALDPRKLAPQFKTHERILQISDELMWALHDYVTMWRIHAKSHPFLLVSHRRSKGAPLSIKGIDGILPRIVETFPELKGIHLHLLRHDSVYTLLESMKENQITLTPEERETEIQSILTYAFGWSPESNMPERYGRKFWEEEADKAMRNRSDQFAVSSDVNEVDEK